MTSCMVACLHDLLCAQVFTIENEQFVLLALTRDTYKIVSTKDMCSLYFFLLVGDTLFWKTFHFIQHCSRISLGNASALTSAIIIT